jgi:hypothetical protein
MIRPALFQNFLSFPTPPSSPPPLPLKTTPSGDTTYSKPSHAIASHSLFVVVLVALALAVHVRGGRLAPPRRARARGGGGGGRRGGADVGARGSATSRPPIRKSSKVCVTGFSRWVKGQAQGLAPGGFKLWVNWILKVCDRFFTVGQGAGSRVGARRFQAVGQLPSRMEPGGFKLFRV